MKDQLLFIVVLASIVVVCSARCRSNNDCSFGGTCIAGRCSCRHSCRDKGLLILCGSDGKYYLNYCFLMSRMCELNKEIRVRQVGYHQHCRLHPLNKYVETTERTGYMGCTENTNYCENYGVCARGRTGEAMCLCTPEYEGPRCQIKKAPLDDVTYRLQALTLDQPSKDDFWTGSNLTVIVLVFCVFSGLLSAVVTSAVCQSIRVRNIKRMTARIDISSQTIESETLPKRTKERLPSSSQTVTSIVLSNE